ncbi:ORF6N domain-containing protein [Aquimarina sp. ERC-38]|uniref:ORF6N domain-containing protein n=1 Tax=Aquimarina sp. ERC-38 TaxID=2949996 RepID=UPI0022455E22|nr:ORF6N domain-containing protein [Aquimarina sp. ERC-38]UZO82143.1 ORF6N domain-containing protein [Aquimarina sp. ERC-38]
MAEESFLPDEIITTKIYLVRGQKVRLDRDLAELYQVQTKRLKEAVRRNLERFPEDFMFEMTKDEFANWRTQFATSNSSDKMGLRYPPFVFTEQGVAMLSSVLNSPTAIKVNIQIIRVFTKIRAALSDNLNLKLEIEEIKKKVDHQSKNIELVFSYLDELLEKQEEIKKPTPRIGYKK